MVRGFTIIGIICVNKVFKRDDRQAKGRIYTKIVPGVGRVWFRCTGYVQLYLGKIKDHSFADHKGKPDNIYRVGGPVVFYKEREAHELWPRRGGKG